MGSQFSSSSSDAFIAEALDVDPTAAVNTGDAELRARLVRAMDGIRHYNDNQPAKEGAIRAAIGAAEDVDAQHHALEQVAPSVRQIVEWFDLSADLSSELPRLLAEFERERSYKVVRASSQKKLRKSFMAASERKVEATRTLALLFVFLIEFDTAKVSLPAIQNDFSFLRRSAAKNAANVESIIPKEKMLSAQLFIAESSPFLKTLPLCLSGNPNGAKSVAELCAMCVGSVLAEKRLASERVGFALQVATSAFVVYDHALKAPGGAFGPASAVNAKKVVTAIRKRGLGSTGGLFSTLRYTALNYGKAPAAVQGIVEDDE